jgi:hypothetical protein
LKTLTGSVRFWFYKPEIEKTEPNRTQTEQKQKNRAKPKKPSKTKKTKSNQFEPVFVQKNRTEPKPVLVRFCFFF